MPMMPLIYEFKNYREYLSAFYTYNKMKNSNFSYKTFSKLAGINSPNYLSLVIEGSRNLTIQNIQQFAQALKLNSDELEYFEALVLYNQAKSKSEQYYYSKRINKLKANKVSSIERKLPGEILQEWYSIGVLVLAHNRTIEQAQRKITTELGLPKRQIEVTLKSLMDSNALQLDDKQILKMSTQQITFHDPKGLSKIQEKYLLSQLNQSILAFRRDYNKKNAKFLSHTLTVPPAFFDFIRDQCNLFLEKITQEMDAQTEFDQEELAQINIQIFKPHV